MERRPKTKKDSFDRLSEAKERQSYPRLNEPLGTERRKIIKSGEAVETSLRVKSAPLNPLRMGWATPYIDKLRKGGIVQFRPRGNSMSGKIESGQLCTVVAANPDDLQVGDIVLCKVNGYQYIHLIKARHGYRFQIGNNRGRINGWIGPNAIYGKCVRVE